MERTARRGPTAEERHRWELTAEAAWHVRRSLAAVRDRLRVARMRAADRQWLADNARAAGQEAFEAPLREAAAAHVATARALEETMTYLERCWSRIEDQRRAGERSEMRLRVASVSSGDSLGLDWRSGE